MKMGTGKVTKTCKIQYMYCTLLLFLQAARDSGHHRTDKKENQIFLIYKEIQSGAVAKSYMTNGLLRYGISSYIRKPFLICDFATAPL
jgi:hypothetical protein